MHVNDPHLGPRSTLPSPPDLEMPDEGGAALHHDEQGADPPAPPAPALEHYLPSALLASILSRHDPRSLCSASATCHSFRAAASHALSFLPSFNLLWSQEITLTADLLGPLLSPNPHLKSLKLDCSRLDDSSISFLARPSLHNLYLHNCENLSGRLLAEIGGKCRDIRLSLWHSIVPHSTILILAKCGQMPLKFFLVWRLVHTRNNVDGTAQ